jgi:hypothetical protein
LGKDRAPRVRAGRFVRCLIRGKVEVVGFTHGPIPWPLGKANRRPSVILYADLVKAVRRESELASAHWWSVGHERVWMWRRALGVGATTVGTSRLRSDYTKEPWAVEAWASRQGEAAEAQRRPSIAEAKRGKPRPRHVIDAMRDARLGSHRSEETRQQMSEVHKRRGTWPPAAGRPWTPEDDELVRTLSIKEAAGRTGRTELSVKSRRRTLRGKR